LTDQGVDETGKTFAGAAYEYFDGNGNIEGVFSHHDYGEVSIRHEPFSGTYTVNRDCTGHSTYPDLGAQYDLFIAPSGDKFAWVQTSPRRSEGLSGVEERVTPERIGQ